MVAVLIIGLEYTQCTPAKKLWNLTYPGHCWDFKNINDWDFSSRKSNRKANGAAGNESESTRLGTELGAVTNKTSCSRSYGNRAGDQTFEKDGESDEAHILRPDGIGRSVKVRVHSPRKNIFDSHDSKGLETSEYGDPWERCNGRSLNARVRWVGREY